MNSEYTFVDMYVSAHATGSRLFTHQNQMVVASTGDRRTIFLLVYRHTYVICRPTISTIEWKILWGRIYFLRDVFWIPNLSGTGSIIKKYLVKLSMDKNLKFDFQNSLTYPIVAICSLRVCSMYISFPFLLDDSKVRFLHNLPLQFSSSTGP